MQVIETSFKWNGTFVNGENKPDKIVLHHSESINTTVLDIHRWHLANGWAGIGYQYYIDKNGNIYRGRQEGWRGSHCPSANYSSIGICFEGKYDIEIMPKAQFDAGIALINDINSRRGTLKIYGHKELYSTSCPGALFPLQDFKNGARMELTTVKVNEKEGEYMSKKYVNGSTPEPVFSDLALTTKIGSLDPHEEVEAIADIDNKIVVLYRTFNSRKVGFVCYRGGL